jgi:hypothetical protein
MSNLKARIKDMSKRVEAEKLQAKNLNTMRDSVKSNAKLSLLAVCEFVGEFQRIGNLVKKAVVTWLADL